MDRQEVLCTTYQMRNFYAQLRDGFFSTLDVMNYIQHFQIALKWCAPGNHVLDVCCGRGLMLPLLRYHQKEIGSYTGVDIEPKNATWLRKRVTDGKEIEPEEYYPFPVRFVEANVAEMAEKVGTVFDTLIYTSAIEHMHLEDGRASLRECRQLAHSGSVMVLTCPNTPEDQDGYDTRYRAHVYEWKRSELLHELESAGWKMVTEWGLTIGKKELMAAAKRLGLTKMIERVARFVPPQFYLPVFAPMFPRESSEIGMLCRAV